MYFDHYVPWEHYPKNLTHHEMMHPLSVLDDFFTCDSVKGHSKRLKEWHYYVVNDAHYDEKRHGPGTLLFIYDLNLKLLEAMFLLLCSYRNFSYRRKKLTEAQLEEEKQQWRYYPGNLNLKQQLNPYITVKKAFEKITPQAYRDHLHEWSHAALYNNVDTEGPYAGEIISVYENLLKLYSAAWLIYQRESGEPLLKHKSTESEIVALPATPVELRTISPNPTPAEKLALEELKNLVLNRCPQVQMIVHLGVHPEPCTFFLLVLISDEEKTQEHEIGNKIEDNCQYLARVHAIVHKANSAKEALHIDRRFWTTVLRKGLVVYQAPGLVLPECPEITPDILLERAKFNWERWGVQGGAFLQGAELYRSAGNFRLAVFLLHQSVESTLKGIIQAVIGYRVQMHNLSRLLRLTLLFTDALKAVFDFDTLEGTQLFTLLQNAYSQSRYHHSFDPEEQQVGALTKQAENFHQTAERIYRQYIGQIKIQ